MAFTLVTAQTILARNAGVLYGLQLGAADMAAYALQIGTTPVSQAAFLNSVYTASVGTASVATVADVVVTGLGIKSTNTVAYKYAIDYVTTQLNTAAAAKTQGSAINDILTLFSNLGTTDSTWGPLVTAYNNQVTNALTHASTTGSANGSFANVSTTIATGSGSTFTLTTGVDTVGTSATVINGILTDSVTAATTWAVTDNVTGTSGTTDVMNVRIINAAAANSTLTFTGLQTSDVERLNFSLTDGTDGINTTSIATGSFTGATTLAVAGSTNVNATSTVRDIIAFTGVAATVALELGANTSQTNTSVTTVGTLTSADSFTLNTVGGSNGVVTLTDAAADGFVTVNIASSGTVVSTIKTLDTKSSNTTIKVTGTGALTITDVLGTSVKTFDASAATGVIKAGVVASATLSAKGGTATTDVLAISAVDSSILTGAAITGFETVSLVTTAAQTGGFALNQITGATAINIGTNTAATGSLTLSKAAATQGLNYVGGASSTASYTFNAVTETLATDGTADAATVSINNAGTATTGTAIAGALGLGQYESATITVANFATSTLGIITLATAATALTINAATNVVLGAIAGATALATINASGSAGNVTVNVGTSIAALTYTGSAGVDTVNNGTIAAGVLQTYNLGAGNDVFTMAAMNATGQIQLNGEAGDDTFNVTTTMVATTVTVGIDGGTGTDSLLLGGAGNAAVFDTFVSVERYQDNTDQDVTFTVVSGYADALAITTINTAGVTTFTTSAASATVNLANLTFSGAAFGAVTQLVLSTTGNGATFLTGSATQATTITGGTGVDTIVGGTGADAITAGAGMDSLTGGTGADTFSFAVGSSSTAVGEFDTIADFLVGTDKLQITAFTDVVSTQQAAVQAAVSALTVGSSAAVIETAMLLANTTDLAVSFATFGGDSYVLAETTGANTAATAGIAGTTVFIKLTGITVIPQFGNDMSA